MESYLTVNFQKRKPLPDIQYIISSLAPYCNAKYFSVTEIPLAVQWAKEGGVSIHENYSSLRTASYHVLSKEITAILLFCKKIGIPSHHIKSSEYYRFWHLTWFIN